MIQHRGSDCGIEQQHHDGIIEACTSNTWYRTAGRQGPCCLSPPTDLNVFKIHPHHVVIVELLPQALTGPTPPQLIPPRKHLQTATQTM
jgi:hypothetical protein